MRRTCVRALACCLILFCVLPIQAQHKSPTTASRAQIRITPENADRLHLMEIDLCHGDFVPGRHFTTDLTAEEITHIRNLGFEVDILIEDVIHYYQTQEPGRSPLFCQEFNYNYPVPKNFELGSMGGYLTYPEILDALDLMQILYPNLISIRQRVGSEVTHQGRPLYWARISDNPEIDEPEPEVLYTALHHAREPMSMMQMIYYMWYLLENYGKDPEATYLVNNTEMYFIPCVNPDGYLYNQQIEPAGGGMWRKNLRDNDGDGKFDERFDGVDLNRNYGYQWAVDNKGSSGNPSSQVYRGPDPFSEPETRAIRQFIEQRNVIITLNYHSYGNYFIYPWGYTEDNNPDLLTFHNYGELLSLDNGFRHGTSVETVGYPTNGSSDDWMYGEHGIFAMTPELGDGEHGFWPHHTMIIPMSQASLKNNLALAHLTHQYALATEVNRGFFTSREGYLDIQIKRYGSQLGDMALTVMSLSPQLVINADIHEVSMDAFEEEMISVDYLIEPSVNGGAELTFIIILDNGFFEFRDTVVKIFAGEILAFYDEGEDMSAWTATGTTWSITDETAFSGSTCLTDSPYSLYAPNQHSIILITEPIDLQDAIHAVLEFRAKWEIEEYIDYAQVQVSTDGISFHALCGQYSRLGSVFQVREPVYDGIQTEWVKESIDLSAYAGELLYLRFVLVSDGFLNMDGIYLDDLFVYVYHENTTADLPVTSPSRTLRVWPNPVSDRFWAVIENTEHTADTWISVTNMLGIETLRISSAHARTIGIPAKSWMPGLYNVHHYTDGRLVETRRIIVH
jgi:carboxypeptidase T